MPKPTIPQSYIGLGDRMLKDSNFKDQIHQANVEVHRFEAPYYELLHPEVFSSQEQKRIITKLRAIDRQIVDNQRNVLDVGAGTGNLTGKLLKMGYKVTATDISAEMCSILKQKFTGYLPGKLTIINSPIEDLSFDQGKFDLITFYSVLHHLPDYLSTLHKICGFLRKSGVMYIDHEASPSYWKSEPSSLSSLVKGIYFHSNPAINSLYFQLIGLKVPVIDYAMSDYWHKKEHALNHQEIAEVFNSEGFELSKRTDYYQHATWTPNPLFPIYRLLCQPEMSYWVAKK
ncbi:MAG: class I SAM-dependent methyltransferase [Bacillota bacterium]